MMQQGLVGNSGDIGEGEGGGLNEEEKGRSEESERNSGGGGGGGGGSRWPRQETIALLKIRSDMDVAFRDSSLKGPLWDEVSRKLSELGYHRSAKKCKEKFENVYKYHKRTKDGRNTKADGKTYRFFEQLEALDTHPSLSLISPSPINSQPHPTILTSLNINMNMNTSPVITVSSNPSPISTFFPSNAIHPINFTSFNIPMSPRIPTQKPAGINVPNLPPSYGNQNMSFSTSSTSSDEQPERFGKRKRKWEDFFGRLMSEVIRKQDELQHKFLDTLEKRERDRMAREEAWRAQEMVKVNQERERLLQQRSMAAAKDAAVISFLQKVTEQHQNSPITVPPILTEKQAPQTQPNVVSSVPLPRQPGSLQASQPQQPVAPPPAIVSATTPVPALATTLMRSREEVNFQSSNHNVSNENNMLMSPSPSRWPKAEVQALIKLRTTLDTKYNDNGAKGPLWEEISGAMRKMGYNRNAKRCKEKWENINKYYKKVKESNKKRPEDAKTCPYFHQLEAIYKDKNATNITNPFNPNPVVLGLKPENPVASVPVMAQREQQWSVPQEKQHHKEVDHESENMDDTNLDDEYEDDEEEEDEGAGYEIVTNKQQTAE